MAKRMTCVFDFDLLALKSNPFHADTQFGRPVIISDGDLAAELLGHQVATITGLGRGGIKELLMPRSGL